MPAASKPLGQKAYGSIGHLPDSRLGPGDHRITDGQAAICLHRPRDRKDRIIVQEKLDGSCVALARIGDEIIALGRSGYAAASSPYEQHQLFAAWARTEPIATALLACLNDGERLVGEWLAQAHGTRYDLTGRDPFVAFDLMTGHVRLPYDAFRDRVQSCALTIAPLLSDGPPIGIQDALDRLGTPRAIRRHRSGRRRRLSRRASWGSGLPGQIRAPDEGRRPLPTGGPGPAEARRATAGPDLELAALRPGGGP